MRERYITSEPEIMMGKPVVAGTRITVELILEKLAAGESIEQHLPKSLVAFSFPLPTLHVPCMCACNFVFF